MIVRKKGSFKATQINDVSDHPAIRKIPEKYKDVEPVKMGAIGLIEHGIFEYPNNTTFVFKGDWVLDNCNGSYYWVYSDEEFNKLFEKVLDK